jgi:Mg-chelatase subunit ChlD
MNTQSDSAASNDDVERLRRWRLVLGGPSEPSTGPLDGRDARIDAALSALYDGPSSAAGRSSGGQRGGLGASAPAVIRWLDEVRDLFGPSHVQLLQRDAVDRLGLTRLLVEPELMASLVPDVELVGILMTLASALPERAKAAARQVIAKVVEDLDARLRYPLQESMRGALRHAARTSRPQLRDLDWDRTIRANLQHYQSDLSTIIPEHLVGYGRRRQGLDRHVIVAVDQSASMAASAIHAAVLASALGQVRTLKTSLVVFDTAVVDLTDLMADPVDVLMSVQLGGGTDIHRAVSYCATLIERPRDAVVVLITDLYEGGAPEPLLARLGELRRQGVTVLVLTALSDTGSPSYDSDVAAAILDLDIAVGSCTPDQFGNLLAAALSGQPSGRLAT